MLPQLDSRTWRADLLQLILNVVVTLGVLVYVLSVTWARQEGLKGIIIRNASSACKP
jgi:hypothetical protein